MHSYTFTPMSWKALREMDAKKRHRLEVIRLIRLALLLGISTITICSVGFMIAYILFQMFVIK